jgi:His-Xaa-Ser system radical SAM maturase HxsC
MEEKNIEKLFYTGEARFNGEFIVKIHLSDKFVDERSNSALLLCEKNKNDITESELSKFDMVLVAPSALSVLQKINVGSKIKVVKSREDLSFLEEGDIIELFANGNIAKIIVLYRLNSNSNVIVATNLCNNKCTMCPQPVHVSSSTNSNIARIEKILRLMDRQTKFLTITGGEPTLLKEDLIQTLEMCKRILPNTKIQLLTNGRMFSYISFVDAINSVGLKSLEIGIPLHSDNESAHDLVTQNQKSFRQTVTGIKNLISSGNNIEIRVVIQKNNYLDLEKIADFIIVELVGVNKISFMGMEMLGSAAMNVENVWVPYSEIGKKLRAAILKLLTHNFKVDIYNIPLCKIDEDLRPLCAKSISDYKVRYLPECESCKEKNVCGGVFSSSLNLVKGEGINPIT